MSTRGRSDKSLLAHLATKGQRTPQIRLRPVDGDMQPGKVRAPENRYEHIEKIAGGAMGVIVRAQDADIGREVAIKVLRHEYADRPEVVQRFIEEAQIGGQLQHPGLVPVYEIGVLADERPYFAMKLVKGQTFRELLEDRADLEQDRGTLIRIFELMCEAIAYAHARGVIHRDLKPSNVLVGAFGEVQVVDWGLAKVIADGGIADDKRARGPRPDKTIVATVRSKGSEYPSIEGVVMGTPEYMPPEQAMGEIDELDERADVFALGAILCEILTGLPPYAGEDSRPVILAARGSLDPAYQRLDACGADSELIDLCKACLARDRIDRPRNAARIATRLRAYATSRDAQAQQTAVEAVNARAAAALARANAEQVHAEATARRRGRLQVVAIAAIVLVGIVAGGAGYFVNIESQKDRIARAEAGVHAALREARELQGQQMWAPAVDAARRSVELARAADVGTRTSDRASEMLASIESEYEQVVRDERLIEALGEAKERWSHVMDARHAEAFYERTFKAYGIDTDRLTDSPYIQAFRDSRVALELAEGLMAWSWLRMSRREVSKKSRWDGIFAANEIDPAKERIDLRLAIGSRKYDLLKRAAYTLDTRDISTDLIGMIGGSLTRAEEVGVAIALLDRAVAANPKDVWLRMHLGRALYIGGYREAALRAYMAAVALRPDSPRMHIHLGDAFIQTNRNSDALPYYDRALELDPNTIRAYVGKALCYMDAKAWKAAEEVLAQAIEIDPGASNPHWLLGDVHERQQRYTAAQKSYERATEADPWDHTAWRSLGQLHMQRTRDYKAAAEAYRHVVEIQPASAPAWANLGAAVLWGGDPLAAIPMLKRSLELDPNYGFGHATLARAYWDLHRYADAYPHLKWVTDRKLNLVPAGYTDLAKRLGAVEVHLEELRAGTYEPASAVEWQTFGHLLYETRFYAEASDLYARAYEVDPSLASDDEKRDRYNGACAAALAAGGIGKDADALEEAERATHRSRALEWLTGELAWFQNQLANGASPAAVERYLLHWKADSDLTAVRGPAIDALPAGEVDAWRKLWADVDKTLGSRPK